MLAILTSCPLPIWGVSYCGGCAMYLTDHCGREHSWTPATVTMRWNPSLTELVLRLLLPQLLPIFMWVWLGYRFVLARHGTYLLTHFGSETPSWLSKTCLDLDCTVVWGSPIWFSVLLSVLHSGLVLHWGLTTLPAFYDSFPISFDTSINTNKIISCLILS